MRRYIILLMLALIAVLPEVSSAEDNGRLLKIVAISRHGVRAPTQDHKLLSFWSQKTWPAWPVERGFLTPRGASLITAMWRNLQTRFVDLKFLPVEICSKPELVYVRADTDERTRATARAMLEGIAPECDMGFLVADEKLDPLFHPVKGSLYKYDGISAVTDVLARASGSLENLQEYFNGPVNLIGKITGPLAPELCARFGLSPGCYLDDLPNAVSVAPDGKSVHITGSLGISSNLAEIFLLEYGEWPGVSAGWGNVNSTILAQILPVHTRIFDTVNRATVVAWAQGSPLLNEMVDALFDRHPDKRLNEAKLAVFVGHDTNIANLGGLLGLNWQLKGYPMNGIPPGGVLFFELWEKQGRKFVHARFFAQPIQALHAPFTENEISNLENHAPLAASVTAPPVVGQAIFTMEEFERKVANATAGAPAVPSLKTVPVYPGDAPQP